MTISKKWQERFISLAKNIALWSKDPKHKIGAIIVNKDRHICSTGYNGFPMQIEDLSTRLYDKDTKRKLMIHAEENAILTAKCDISGTNIFVYGYPPCVHCSLLIIQAGIKKVYFRCENKEDTKTSAWKEDWEMSRKLFEEASVELIEI